MKLNILWASLALGSVVGMAGCCCGHGRTSCSPGVCGSVALPGPAPCCGAPLAPPPPAAIGATAPVYSSPVPLYPGVR